MKILILSDSHGDVETMRRVAVAECPDKIIHLGDCVEDANQLGVLYSKAEMIAIPGNTDSKSDNGHPVQYTDLCGKRVMLTHGHTFGVHTEKNGMRNINGIDQMALYGFENGASIILFGHSHEPYINCRGGKWIMNPGRIGRISSKTIHATYGVLHIGENGIKWRISEVEIL